MDCAHTLTEHIDAQTHRQFIPIAGPPLLPPANAMPLSSNGTGKQCGGRAKHDRTEGKCSLGGSFRLNLLRNYDNF